LVPTIPLDLHTKFNVIFEGFSVSIELALRRVLGMTSLSCGQPTTSLSGNLGRGLCFRIMAMSCRDWSAHVRRCVPPLAVIVTQLVTHHRRLSCPSKQCQPALDRPPVFALTYRLGDRFVDSGHCCFPGESWFAHRLTTAQCLRFPPRSGMRLARGTPQLTLSMRTVGMYHDPCGFPARGSVVHGRARRRLSAPVAVFTAVWSPLMTRTTAFVPLEAPSSSWWTATSAYRHLGSCVETSSEL
jgi:hypothetical protein